jgi:hypothetical protein
MTLKTALARYGVTPAVLLVALLIGGCERSPRSAEPAKLTLPELYVLAEQPRSDTVLQPDFGRICAARPDPALCDRAYLCSAGKTRCSDRPRGALR